MPNRTLCSVLEEMRKAYETRNFSHLLGLIEEAQSLANRMESALWDQKDYTALQKKLSRLNKEVKELEEKRNFLSPESAEKSAGRFSPFTED
jgi:predicted RNase H-like nuclease (RuvC/YqgF family)